MFPRKWDVLTLFATIKDITVVFDFIGGCFQVLLFSFYLEMLWDYCDLRQL